MSKAAGRDLSTGHVRLCLLHQGQNLSDIKVDIESFPRRQGNVAPARGENPWSMPAKMGDVGNVNPASLDLNKG
jgi:hypothetical protein